MRITPRTKLGYGYSTQPAREGARIVADTEPSNVGTLRQILDGPHRDNLRLFNTTTWWTWSLYVQHAGQWCRLGQAISREIASDFHLRDYDFSPAPWFYLVDTGNKEDNQ